VKTTIAGNFKPYIEGLVEQKKSLGYPYNGSARILKVFSNFCATCYPDEKNLTKEIAMRWAEKRQDEHVNGLIRRITPVRQLAKYMNSIGIDAYLIPRGIPGKQVRYVPHIYTDQELHAFFAEADRCVVSPFSGPARHLIIPVIFRLLYCCGLRSSEARLLTVEDVDLGIGKLTIRQSKGNKDRTVMMSDEILNLCCIFHSKISRIFPDRVAFFPNQNGKHYNVGMIDYWFHLVWNKTGITNSSGNPPRVHDFRHTFAVKRLNTWVQEGKDLNTFLPYLCMYLGHAHLTETDYYLHFVPEFFPLFKEKTFGKSANLIPEVNYEAG
jgi:integrase/recombinase XerD